MVSKSHQKLKSRFQNKTSMYRWWNFLSHLISCHRKTFKVTEVVLSFNRVLLRITLRDCFKKVTKRTKHINMFTANCKNLLQKKRFQILLHFHKFRNLHPDAYSSVNTCEQKVICQLKMTAATLSSGNFNLIDI